MCMCWGLGRYLHNLEPCSLSFTLRMSQRVAITNLDNVFTSFAENWKLAIEKLKEDAPREPTPDFALQEYWSKLDAVIKSISFDATKTTLSFSKPPPPTAEQCQSMFGGIQTKILALVSMYYKLPAEQGCTLRKVTARLLVKIVAGFLELIQKIKQERYLSSQEQLQNTGEVWAACDSFARTPRDNKEAVLREIKAEAALVKDALEELKETLQQESFDDDLDFGSDDHDEPLGEPKSWSVKEKALLTPLSGLVKASRSCFKKIIEAVKGNGNCSTPTEVKQLDDLMGVAREVTPLIDDLVSSISPPLESGTLRQSSSKLADVLHKFLDHTQHSHLCGEADLQWIDFLHKAINHNLDQIGNMTKADGQG